MSAYRPICLPCWRHRFGFIVDPPTKFDAPGNLCGFCGRRTTAGLQEKPPAEGLVEIRLGIFVPVTQEMEYRRQFAEDDAKR